MLNPGWSGEDCAEACVERWYDGAGAEPAGAGGKTGGAGAATSGEPGALPRGAGVSVAATGSGSTDATKGEEGTGDGGKAPFEASAGEVALARVE